MGMFKEQPAMQASTSLHM